MTKYLRTLQTFVPFLHDLRYRWKIKAMLRKNRPHELDFHFLERLQTPDGQPDILDIGANRGEALASILTMGPHDARVKAFEPNPLVCAKLERLLGSHDRVEIFNVGLGAREAELDLYVPVYRRWAFDGLASFDPDAGADWLRQHLWRFRERHLRVEVVRCRVKMLDQFDFRPFFIKMDVEGYEVEVLKGGLETLRRHRPLLLLETVDRDAQAILSELDYELYRFDGEKLQPGVGDLNSFCLAPHHREQFA